MKLLFSLFVLYPFLILAESKEVIATGEPMSLNLRGKDGRDGARSHFCRYARNGEDGANGTDLIVRSEKLENLSKILVYSEGGKGGSRGICTFRNRRGNRTTSYGSTGSNGHVGQLYVIPPHLVLLPETTAFSTRLETMADRNSTPVTLTRNIWSDISALELLSPGSLINPVGHKYVKTVQQSIIFEWKAELPRKGELWFGVTVRLDKDGNLILSPKMNGLTLETKITTVGKVTTIKVLNWNY